MEIKKSVLIPLLIIFVMILGLTFAVYWHFKSFQQSLSEVNLPKFKMPEINSELWGQKEGYKEWTSPDEKLKINYPGYWLEMEEESFKNYFLQSTEKAETLFFAYRFNLKNLGALNFLVIQKLNLGKNLEKIIEQMEKDAEESGGEMKILDLNIGEGQAEFEAKHKSNTGNIFYSKEKLLLAEENVYLVGIYSQKNDWSKIKNEASEILGSIQIIP